MDETIGPQEIADQQKVVEAAVTPKQLVEEFGDQHLHQDKDGWRVDLKDEKGRVDMKKVRTFSEMDRDRRKHATEAADRAQAKVSQVTIKGPGGRPIKVDERHAERIERQIFERERGRR